MSILRWDPIRELRTMRRTLERLLDEFVEGFGTELEIPERRLEAEVWRPAVELYETDTDVVVRAALPGVDPKSIDVQVDDRSMTLAAERREEREERGRSYHRREMRYGRFERTLPLPVEVKPDQARATYRDGVLEVRVPKAEAAQARKVRVEVQ
ncbi:MAG: Hsp20/alpha crystallin family protein [Armatimonadota bacterium]|nr:Hsp20/alpha crystallin family protein [Armatimonadota bacterium]MDR7438988.1 Hsp20/alpha crystallin family protein [Armatimonadota bacterium]MDR7563272.1 Hsp20/alpha crystallin family protein [Armatimonadota bacterium]MDR7566970.1 Hsp20/alpha crystallin family protein [Armatimonadota bacterium]MDR7602059.1 Hsp20/alpha crystallin family protein [Armatimonadota bacterium]